MRNKHTNTREILLLKTPPQTLIKPTDPVIRIRRALPVWDPIKEMPVIRALLPHPLHLRTAGLEVPEILLPYARLFVDLDGVAVEGRGRGGVGVGGGEGAQDAFGRFAGAAVGRGVELEGVVRS